MSAWKPGDVAMVTMDGSERRAIRSEDGSRWVVEPQPWVSPRKVTDARPLVVIDPEDAEQVERLARSLPVEWNLFQTDDPELGDDSIAAMQAALCEFADPKPRIEEPTGLGAVVRDSEGAVHVRHALHEDDRPWCDENGIGHNWSEFDAIEELAAGWTE